MQTALAPLRALHDLAQSLVSSRSAASAMSQALEVVEEDLEAAAAFVALVDDATGELEIAAACGLAAPSARRVRFRLDEGITGRVVKTGRPVVVPKASREPLLLDRTGVFSELKRRRREASFICVPIPAERQRAGALSATLPYHEQQDLAQTAAFLGVAAAMLGQALRVHRRIEEDRRRLLDENRLLKEELKERYDLSNIVGTSHAMRRVYEQIAQAAPSNATVLIRGESGTGKELVAHAIHYGSPRAKKPLVKVSCAALPETLIEAELFGHEAGAFTDARSRKAGRFELASGGSLFLDEVGELSGATQVKLLRVLQEREFERLGGTQPVRVDVRLVAATNRDLEAAVRDGTFREDLYYRLNVFTIVVPPLRERKPDIPLLADHFVTKLAAEHGKDVRRIATTAIDMMMSYHWPGNVRELANCIERAVLVCDGGVIHAHHLPPTLQTAEVSGTLPQRSLAAAVGAFEKDLLLDAVKISRGNKARASRLLQTTERILSYKLREHGIDARRFRR